MKKLYSLVLAAVCTSALIVAQPTFTFDETSGDPGGIVSVNVKVKDFTDIVGMQFSINWDPTVLQFSALTNITNTIRDFDAASFNLDPKFTDQGQMVVSWFDMGAEPNSVPDGTIIFTLDFDIVGGSGSSTTVTTSDEPRKTEVINSAEEDIGLVSEGGLFTVSGNGGGGGSLRLIGSDEEGAMGENVCVEISVRGFTDIAGMQFSLNWDADFLSYTSVGAFNLNGLNEGSFNLDNVASGQAVLQWLEPSSEGITLADDTRIFQICFDIIGTSGSRSVQFTNTPLAIEIVDGDDMRVNFTKKDGTVAVAGGGGGSDCNAEGFALVAESSGPDPSTEVCVGISVKDFTDILTIASSVEWDPNILSNPRIANLNLAGLAEGNFNLDQGANGMLSFVWIDNTTEGVTLADGVDIFDICFDVIGSLGQNTTVSFSDALTTREVSDVNGEITFNQCDGEINVGGGGNDNITCAISTPTCQGEADGSINISVNFGSAPYTFEWTQGGNVVGSGEDLSNIAAGTYIVNVTDAGGTTESKEVVVSEPNGVQITNVEIVDPTDGANGSIALTLTGGATPLTFAWSNGATTRDIAGLEDGTYTITITESNGCEIDSAFGVGAGELTLEISAEDFNGSGVSCNGEQDGAVTAVARGGTGPYTFQWNDGNTNAARSGLAAGEYSVTVTDGAGDTQEASIALNEPEVLRVNVTTTPSPNGVEGTAQAVVSGGTPDYTYRWNDQNPPSTTRLIINLDVGIYTVVVTDANGCSASGQGEVGTTDIECFTGKSVITPNDDQMNDFFDIACVPGTENELEIYNRQGELVFEATNYNNDWFGLDRDGSELPDGPYYWVLRVRDNGELRQEIGHVTLLRDLN